MNASRMGPTPETGESTVHRIRPSAPAVETAPPADFGVVRVLGRWARHGPWPLRPMARALRRVRDAVHSCRDFLQDRSARWAMIHRWLGNPQLHQPTVLTWSDRYPRLFSECRGRFPDRPELRILSFGCATGEEVISLRRHFPTARIVGCELNQAALERCRRLTVDDGITFLASDFAALAEHAPFDLVFCLAVLQSLPDEIDAYGIDDISHRYPFERFDQQVAELDALVRVGGALVIHHAQYFFRDSSVAWKYDVVPIARPMLVGRIRFTPDGRRAHDPEPSGWVFRKIRNSRAVSA